MPGILLKAKNAYSKYKKAKNVTDTAKSLSSKDEEGSNINKPLLVTGLAFIVAFLFMVFVVVAVSIPQTLFTMFGAVDNTSSTSSGNTTYTVEAPIAQVEGGLPIPHYLQTDVRWATLPYPYSSGGSNTIAASACGPSSFSMVVSYMTGQTYYPPDVLLDGKYHDSGGTSWSYFQAAATQFGIGSVSQTSNWNTVYQALQDGRAVIGSYNGTSLFTNSGHFIVLRGIASDGSVLVNDPNDSSTKQFINRHFTQSEMQQGALAWFIFDKKS